MLVEFTFKNYKSFKDENKISMLGIKSFKEHDETNVFTKGKFKILKSSVLYGNNASGKSNFALAFSVMKKIVMNSFKDSLNENSSLDIEKFLLNSKCEEIPTYFEIVFINNNIRYRYGFEINDLKVTAEWLYHNPSKKEVPLFERDLKEIIINKTSFKEGIGIDDKVRENVLLITYMAMNNGKVSNEVIDWFKKVNVIIGIKDTYSSYTYEKFQKDENFKKWLSLIIQDFEIANITLEETDLHDEIFLDRDKKLKLSMVAENSDGSKSYQKFKGMIIKTWHKRFDENNLLENAIPFDFITQESEGTKKFINLLGPWYDSIKNGKILIVDELDSRLHTRITRKLIELFNNKRNKEAQLIFTSHDVNLLDKDLLRRDQIWFVEKDQFGASSLYSLSDFKAEQVRNTSSFVRNYLSGKYGAVSHIEIDEKMEDLIYG